MCLKQCILLSCSYTFLSLPAQWNPQQQIIQIQVHSLRLDGVCGKVTGTFIYTLYWRFIHDLVSVKCCVVSCGYSFPFFVLLCITSFCSLSLSLVHATIPYWWKALRRLACLLHHGFCVTFILISILLVSVFCVEFITTLLPTWSWPVG